MFQRSLLIALPVLTMGTVPFFPICLSWAKEILSGSFGSSSLSSSSAFNNACRDTRACKALQEKRRKGKKKLSQILTITAVLTSTECTLTCDTAEAYRVEQPSFLTLLGRSGQLCGSYPNSHIPQTRRCRRTPASLLFPVPACSCKCPEVRGRFLPENVKKRLSALKAAK